MGDISLIHALNFLFKGKFIIRVLLRKSFTYGLLAVFVNYMGFEHYLSNICIPFSIQLLLLLALKVHNIVLKIVLHKSKKAGESKLFQYFCFLIVFVYIPLIILLKYMPWVS